MSFARLCVGLFLLLSCALFPSIANGQAQTITYANGHARWQYKYEAGVPEGDAFQFYAGGSLMVRGSYHKGLKHGLFSYYARNGTLQERALYVHGKRKWRSLGSAVAEPPPINLLSEERDPELDPAIGKLETFSHPFVLVIPFSSLDRISKRIGVALGTSTEHGELNGRRGEVFVNKLKGRYGINTSMAVSLIKAAPLANEGDKFLMEQMTLSAVGSYRLVDRVQHLSFLRAGYSRSFDLEPTDDTPVRGVSAGQRASDFASTFARASVVRMIANHFYMREHFVSQVDVGLDAVNYQSMDSGARRNDLIVRLNMGAATGTDAWKFALETANAINLQGPSLYTGGASVTYYSGSSSWTTLNSMVDQHGEVSLLVSTGSWIWD